MKNARPVRSLRLPFAHGAAALASFTVMASALAATDISQTPLVVRSATQAKPNIMLLMDNSGSMGRTHMPDEIESVSGVKSIGYKSAQCNALYYSPAGEYLLPKKYDGAYFNVPAFDAAPYAGYAAFFTAPDAVDLSVTDLGSQFVPYDWGRNTVLGPPGAPITGPSAGFSPATPGPAYYYVYTGSQTLKFDSAACKQLDTGVSVAASGGGTWTRVDVSTRPAVEKAHFALWYSFYRTRLALTKSAASLAFGPLDSGKRVGFITVEPKASPSATTIEADRYLQIGDFVTTAAGQKEQWYAKLFSQKPSGASPTREGLARVGRYYGGIGTSDPRPAGINAGMGGPDPVQYACQQNFTILTTDGYWNGQTQTPGGGGVDLDGNLVGRRDGEPTCTAADPDCVRPIYDGNSASIRTDTDKNNVYNSLSCALNETFRRTEQLQRKVFNITRDTARNQQRTIQFKRSSSQLVAASVQTIKTTKQTTRTTDQYFIETTLPTQDRYQVLMRKDKIERDTEQFQLQTQQQTQQTLQNTEVVTQTTRRTEQWQTSSSQFVLLTTQFQTTQINYREEKKQTFKRQWQYIGVNSGGESSGPLPTATCPTGYTCSEYDQFPNQLVDPATCPTPGGVATSSLSSSNSNPSLSYVHTDCTPGSQEIADHPVAACSAGITPNVVDPATSGNSWVRTSCTRVQSAPAYASGYTVGTCAASSQMPGSPFTITTCAVTVNTSTPQTSCTPGAPVTDPSPPYNTTQCVKPASTNFPATNSAQCTPAGPQTDPGTLITTECTKPIDQTDPAPPLGAGCANNAGTSAPFTKITCGVNPISSTMKAFASCTAVTPSGVPWIKTECQRVAVAPTPSPVPVEFGTCVGGPNAGPYAYDTACDLPPGANNETKFVAAATCGGTTSTTHETTSPFIDRTCTKPMGPNNQTAVPWNPATTCPTNAGTSFPFLRSTCTTIDTMAEVAVERSTCTATTTSTSSPYETTHCRTQFLGGAFVCPGNTPTAFPWIYEECGTATTNANAPYGSCTPNTPTGPNSICRQSVVTVPIAEAACVPDLTPSGTNPRVSCTGPTTISTGAADPATCPATNGPQGGPLQYDISCTTGAVAPYATPTGVQTCPTPAMDPTTFVVTTCSNPAPTNFSNVNSAPCDVVNDSKVGDSGNGWTTTVCSMSDVYVDMTAAACAPTAVAQFGAGPEITCVPNGVTTGQPVNSCTDPVAAGETVTACYSTETTAPWLNYGSACTPGAGSATGERIDCRRIPVGGDVADSGCVPTGPDPSGIIISCPVITGTGYKYRYFTSTTVTVTPVSGGAPTGPAVVSTSNTSPADIGPTCSPTALAVPGPGFPAKPTPTAPCTAWPCSDTAGPVIGGSFDSLADVAQYYYTTDLRPAMPNVVPKAGITLEDDIAEHQHMTTFTLALGVSGTLQYDKDYRSLATGDFAAIRGGSKNWPLWPDPALDYNVASNYDNSKSIDDFWHTAVNGRGRFFSANNPRTVIQGLGEALAKVDAKTAAGAADAVSTLTPVPGNNFVFGSSYESGTWTGDLQAYTLDTTNGGLSTTPAWSAQGLLNGRTANACDSRKIFLMRNTTMVDFAWNTDMCPGGSPTGTLTTTAFTTQEASYFSAANIASLSQFTGYLAGDPQLVAAQADGVIINFLRGQRGNEGYVDPTSTSQLFRTRTNVLGDLVSSQPVYVKAPFANYADAGYEGFKIAKSGRREMVYVGGNDGMLHAFHASVDPADTLRGQEAWAVIPSAVLPELYRLADINYGRGNHRFFVDGSPVAADVCTGACAAAGDWRTILVGGFNAGGRGYYALDVTNPTSPAALWEFKHDNAVCPGSSAAAINNTSDCNLGLSFGKPVVTKLGTDWVVMFTSGYNNVSGASGDGGGFLYVVHAMTGRVMHKIATGAGDGTTPSGLAQINNYVDNVLLNNNTLRAYGGDLLGNVWRFEFSPTPRAVLVGTAKTGGTPQPITTRPELAELNGEPFLLVGTGQLLGLPDITNTQVQSVYGIRDSLTTVPSGSPAAVYPTLANELKTMTLTQIGTGASAQRTVACTADCTRTNGWRLDLPEAGERVNVDMKLVLGTLLFASNVPEDEPCKLDGHSWFNQLNFRTGEAVSTAPIVPSSTGEASSYLGDTLNVGFNVVQLPLRAGQTNPDYVTTTRQSDGSRRRPNTYIAPPDFIGKRISWREIVQ